ncbi:unnamed protein product [Alopecurus aequalis]
MEALPDDLVTEIFSYLPAKSAGRCHSLSRSWRAVLKSASFVRLHLRRANKPGESKVFFSLPQHEFDDDPEESDDDHGDDVSEKEPSSSTSQEETNYHGDVSGQAEESEDEYYDDDDEDCLDEFYFYAWHPGGAVKKLTPNNFSLPNALTRPLHGLVLIRCIDTGYHVCNPSTGAALSLPDSHLPAKMFWRPSRCQVTPPYYQDVTYGLGHCSVTGQYKAVRVFSTMAYHQEEDTYSPILCEVFVLDTLAYWRPAAQQPPMCIVHEDNPGVFLHGSVHFLCRDGSGILTFDVTKESFGSVLSLPSNPMEDAPIKMVELDGNLCICHGDVCYGDGTYHIFMLRDYELGKWEQLYRVNRATWREPEGIQLESSWIAPLVLYNGDNGQKKIMFHTGTSKVFTVDIPHGDAPEVLFKPDETIGVNFEDSYGPRLGLFEESLVPVGRTIEDMVASSPKTKAWFDILKWMPTRSVADLSLVCRSWRAMIKDDHFIRSHIAHANLNRSPRIMLATDATFGAYSDLQDIVSQRADCCLHLHFVCSQPCHGLNAGTRGSRSFACNPVMGQVENIVLEGVDDDTFFAGQTGLAYDSRDSKHLLVFVTYKEKNLATREYKLECKLRFVHGETCESIDPPPRPVADVSPTHVDGKIFWLVDPNLGTPSLISEIVAFNVDTYEFEVLQGPPCSSLHKGHMSMLQVKGALCVACSDKSNNVIDIWMMKEVGIWSMEYHIELSEFSPEYTSDKTTPLVVDEMDGRILLCTGYSLGYYDPRTASVETLYRGVETLWGQYKFCPVICDESFVRTLSE